MSQPIDARLVETRMRDLAQTTVSQTVSLFKGGTFALAAVLLIEIITQPEGRFLRLALWASSFLVALVSYNAYLNTSVINFRESVAGIAAIIVQLMIELMLFATLAPRYAEQAWRLRYAIYGAFLIVTAVRMLYFGMNRNLTVEPDLKSMLDTVELGRRRDSRGLMIAGFVALALAIPILMLPLGSPWLTWLAIGAALLACVSGLNGLYGMHRQRATMERLLNDALAGDAAKERREGPRQ